MRKILLLLAVVLPQKLKIVIYKILGAKIGEQVKIGFSYLDCEQLTIGNNVSIGHFNIVRNLRRFEIGNDSRIKNFNQLYFSGNKANAPEWSASIAMSNNVHFMSHHFIDAGGSVHIDHHTTIAGRDTHFWSHGRVLVDGVAQKSLMSVHIGSRVYIGSRATVVGVNIPDNSIVGAGSIVTKSFPPEDCRLLIAGNPAQIKKRYLETNTAEPQPELETNH